MTWQYWTSHINFDNAELQYSSPNASNNNNNNKNNVSFESLPKFVCEKLLQQFNKENWDVWKIQYSRKKRQIKSFGQENIKWETMWETGVNGITYTLEKTANHSSVRPTMFLRKYALLKKWLKLKLFLLKNQDRKILLSC